MTAPARADLEAVRKVDRAGWGDRRTDLLETACARGVLHGGVDSFLCCQPWKEGTQLGPWGALAAAQAEALLDTALAGLSGTAFLDVPARNVSAAALLTRRGFAIKGTNILMFLGVVPQYEPERIYALASMGSMG